MKPKFDILVRVPDHELDAVGELVDLFGSVSRTKVLRALIAMGIERARDAAFMAELRERVAELRVIDCACPQHRRRS